MENQDQQQVKQRSGVLAKMQDTAQAVLHEDVKKGKDMVADAAKSNAYLYPLRGLVFFSSHRMLWKPLTSKLAAYLALSVSVTTTMFLTTYLPQVAVLVFTSGPLAVFTTVVLILNESAAITNAIARGWLLDDAILDTYDATLIAKGQTSLLSEGRELRSSRDPVGMLGKALKRPFAKFGPKAIIRYLMYLPLNFIPVIGTALFVLIQARSRGRHIHDRYFQLKQTSQSQKQSWYDQHVGSCTSFSLVATVLEMIPLVSILFTFTSTVGSALWAIDLETKSNSAAGTTAPSLREKSKAAE